MSEHPQDALEQWIRTAFEEENEDPKHYPVFQKLFLEGVDQIKRDDEIDVLAERATLTEFDDPESGTHGEWLERRIHDEFGYYISAIREGHGVDYSKAYLEACIYQGGEGEFESIKAYKAIDNGGGASLENPAYRDAYGACRHQKKSEEFAKYCAGHLIEESCSFSDAFQAATDFEKAYQLMLRKGHSEFHATMYAQAIREDYDPQFAEVFARCAEEQMAAGRTLKEAERFAEIYVGLFDRHGSFDEDYEYHDLANEHCMALAEAAYRYRPEFGDKEKFIDAFDQIYQKVSDSPRAGSREWFDEVEARALQRIAAKDAYMAEHGNLRGFEIEEKESSADPARPKPPNFRTMSEEAFQAYRPKSEDEDEDYREEAKYRDWCEEMECDPMDSESRDEYKQQQEGDSWDDMDENDRDGWTDNMNKD